MARRLDRMSAGPSRLSATVSQSSQSHSQSPKKRRHHTLQDVFEKQDREEVERLSLQYRALLSEADGASQLRTPYMRAQ